VTAPIKSHRVIVTRDLSTCQARPTKLTSAVLSLADRHSALQPHVSSSSVFLLHVFVRLYFPCRIGCHSLPNMARASEKFAVAFI
jgi:hypothetical protein